MLLVLMSMICITVGITSVAHRAHIEATSTMSTMVMPFLISVTMSDIINLSWYNFAMNTLQHALFPISPPRYSNLNPCIATRDPYYARTSDELFKNISMMGPGRCAHTESEAALVCLHLNFETKHSKVCMLDSGCNNPMHVLTDDVRDCIADFDTNARITGDQVHGDFTTDASGTLGITLNGIEHFTHQRPFSTGVKSVNFYVRNTVLPEYSCPGQLGKYQNGAVERRIKEIGRMARAMMYTADAPDLASAYCVLQAVDILNMLPSTANPADPASTVTGFSPYLLYFNSAPVLEQLYAFGSFCTVHLDADHIDPLRPNVRAASCIYLCRAHHCHSQCRIVWEHRDDGKGRKLIVPELSSHILNYSPMRSGPDKHLSNSLTFGAPDFASYTEDSRPPLGPCPQLYIDKTSDPMCPHFPDSQVLLADLEERQVHPRHYLFPRSNLNTNPVDSIV
jgi:hypothetical protein